MKVDRTIAMSLIKEIGISLPQSFIFTKADWNDLYVTLREFKIRVLERRTVDADISCPFCDKFDTIREGFCNSCSKRVEPLTT